MEDYTIEDEYTTTYLINMTSQQWLDNSILDRSVWWHYNVIVVPKVIKGNFFQNEFIAIFFLQLRIYDARVHISLYHFLVRMRSHNVKITR
jgi:hypothetical protein